MSKFRILEPIVKLDAFQDTFRQLKRIDESLTINIEQSLKAAIDKFHIVLTDPKSHTQQKLVVLLQEQITIQAKASQYLNICEQMTLREKHLWQYVPESVESFFDRLYEKMDVYFLSKEKSMCKEIEKDGEWYTGIRDTAKKAGSVVNWVVKKANEASKDLTGSKLSQHDAVIDDRTVVERVMERHLKPEQVGKEISVLMSQAGELYQEDWKTHIQSQVPDIKRLSAFNLAKQANDSIHIDFKMGVSEQAFMVGMGSAVVGTLGLAAGWHTITYALINVFPPIAIFAVAATVLLGVLTKQHAIEQRKKQVREAVKQYQRYFMMQFNVVPLPNVNGMTLRKYMIHVSEKIVKQTLAQWEKGLLGQFKMEHYRLLVSAFSKHLLMIQEAIDMLDNHS